MVSCSSPGNIAGSSGVLISVFCHFSFTFMRKTWSTCLQSIPHVHEDKQQKWTPQLKVWGIPGLSYDTPCIYSSLLILGYLLFTPNTLNSPVVRPIISMPIISCRPVQECPFVATIKMMACSALHQAISCSFTIYFSQLWSSFIRSNENDFK